MKPRTSVLCTALLGNEGVAARAGGSPVATIGSPNGLYAHAVRRPSVFSVTGGHHWVRQDFPLRFSEIGALWEVMSKRSVARGALLGAFIGDASGATLEFLDRKPSAEDVERALSMVGGGCWRVAPGQITDDGELALCLARSLAGAQAVDWDKVADAYVGWFNSGPFDCGNATGNAFGRHRARRPRDRASRRGSGSAQQYGVEGQRGADAVDRTWDLVMAFVARGGRIGRQKRRPAFASQSELPARKRRLCRRSAASCPECWRQRRRIPGGERSAQ